MPYFGVPIRNGLPIGLGSVAGFGVQQFSPADLFSAGEQGAWYDPSDLTTLFTDSAGTTPVTGVEQFVGRMNDKSGRGNHATSTGTKRPKLAARYNLLTYTEQFDNGVWSKPNLTIAANSTTAPDNTLTADTLTATTTGIFRTARRIGAGFVANTSFKYEVNFKKNTSDWVALRFWDTGSGTAAWFNINTGTLGTVQTGCTAAITSAGNGWYKCSITRTIGASIGFNELDIMLSSTDNSDVATIGDSVFAWGADLRPASQATGLIGPTYQRVVDAATYDTAGFLPYLQFDGIDDSMSTGSIDFTATDKMTVWAGVRKLSDAAEGCLYELSSNFISNNGSFTQFARGSQYPTGFDTPYRGTSFNLVPGFNAAAPTTRVNTTLYNIAAPSAVVRSNGAQVYSDTTSVGSGNFGNYPLFIGARNNASLYFNGWLSSLIVRGAQSTQSQIEATESWVNGKTGAY